MASIFTQSATGLPVINNINSIAPNIDTNMVPFNGYIGQGGGSFNNYFFPALTSYNSGDLYSVMSSFFSGNTTTISVAPASGNQIIYNNVSGTSITTTVTGAFFTFYVPDGFLGIIYIKDTNGTTFTLT